MRKGHNTLIIISHKEDNTSYVSSCLAPWRFLCSRRYFMDKLGICQANQTSMFKPSSNKYFLLTVPRRCSFWQSILGFLCFVFVVLPCLILAAFWSPVPKGLIYWLSCVMFYRFCHFPMWCSG